MRAIIFLPIAFFTLFFPPPVFADMPTVPKVSVDVKKKSLQSPQTLPSSPLPSLPSRPIGPPPSLPPPPLK